MNEFTKKYAELISRYVDTDELENFHEDIEELLDAYENDTDEPDEIIHCNCDAKIAVNDVPVEKFFKREEPKTGEVYRDIFGEKYFVAAVNKVWSDGTPLEEPFVVLIHMNKSGNPFDNAFTPKLKDFMNPQFVKE